MTKSEAMKCEKLIEEAINNCITASESWQKYENCKEKNNMVEAEIGMREFDYRRGYAEGINQALVTVGFKHDRMKELEKLIS